LQGTAKRINAFVPPSQILRFEFRRAQSQRREEKPVLSDAELSGLPGSSWVGGRSKEGLISALYISMRS
jgi:hypothetical protein